MAETLSSSRSALLGVAAAGRYGVTESIAGVRASLVDPVSLAMVMPAPGQTADCLQALAAAYGADLAHVGPRQSAQSPALHLRWSGPQAYLACMSGHVDIEAELSQNCGATASVVDQSDGKFMLRLSGPAVRKTLAKGVTLDLHPKGFVAGETALTVLAHLNVQLTRVETHGGQGDPTFEVVAARSSAADLWSWLEASAGEFGLDFRQDPF